MPTITSESTLQDVAAIVSSALERAGVPATLSGGAAVSIYSDNEYQSKDLDFVTAATVAEISPVLSELGFVHTGVPRLSQFSHPMIDWFIEFPPTPISFGHLHVTHEQCAIIDLADALGTSPKLWMNLQATFDLDKAAKVRRVA